MIRFVIGTQGVRFTVRVYESRREMQVAYRAWPHAEPDDDGWAARVSPVRVMRDGRWMPTVGYVWLSRDHCGTQLIAHEVVHMALAAYREISGVGANFGKQCSKREESLAWLYQALFGKMNVKLHDLGIWS